MYLQKIIRSNLSPIEPNFSHIRPAFSPIWPAFIKIRPAFSPILATATIITKPISQKIRVKATLQRNKVNKILHKESLHNKEDIPRVFQLRQPSALKQKHPGEQKDHPSLITNIELRDIHKVNRSAQESQKDPIPEISAQAGFYPKTPDQTEAKHDLPYPGLIQGLNIALPAGSVHKMVTKIDKNIHMSVWEPVPRSRDQGQLCGQSLVDILEDWLDGQE